MLWGLFIFFSTMWLIGTIRYLRRRNATPEQRKLWEQERQARIKRWKDDRAFLRAHRMPSVHGVEYVAGLSNMKPRRVTLAKVNSDHSVSVHGRVIRVTRCDWIERGRRSGTGALIGGAIGDLALGLPGAVAGAMVGGRRRNASLTALTATVGGIETVVYFRTTAAEHARIMSIL